MSHPSPIDRAIEYVTKVDADFEHNIAPAEEAEIQRLEMAAGRPCPQIYREFLLRMGHGTDWIGVFQLSFDIGDVTSMLEDAEKWRPPERFFQLAVDPDDPYYHGYLQGDAGGRFTESSPVVAIPPLWSDDSKRLETAIRPVSGSLMELICSPAYTAKSIARRPFQERLIAEQHHPNILSRVDQLVDSFGLERQWFSSEQSRYYDSGDLSLSAVQPPKYGLALHIAGDDNERLADASALFKRELGLTTI